jgi:hypothetical protein
MPQMQRSRAMQPESLCGGGEDERGGRKQDIANSKPATGVDDTYPESSFFKAFPCENRRIDDSARGRVGNGACARCRSISTQQNILLGTTPFYPAMLVAGYGDVVPSNSNAAPRSSLHAEVRQRPPQHKR